MKLKDKYFKRPILYDYLVSTILVGVLVLLSKRDWFNLPKTRVSVEFASDLAAIGLTVSGFILTLVTILITLRSGQVLANEKVTNDSSPFNIFLASSLYNRAVNVMKYGVLSLVLISLLLYLFKLLTPLEHLGYIFYLNLICLVVILATFIRSFIVIDLIMAMQKAKSSEK